MDSRDLHLQQQQQQQQHHQQQQQHHLPHPHQQQIPLMGFNRNPNSGLMVQNLNQNRGLPFQYHHHAQIQQQQQMDQKTLESLGFEGSPSSGANQQQAVRFGIESVVQGGGQGGKKKRGRPRKYAPDGNIALGLAPTSPIPSASNSYGGGEGGGGGGDSGGGNVNNSSSDPPAKRNRGRPPGSGKKQLDALGGTGGVGFTPHVIEVQAGEDIAAKVLAFSRQGPRAICILSATGAVSSALLAKGSNNGTVKCEGPYEIISLSGSFLNSNSESNGSMNKTGSLSVSLASPDGAIVGGNVAGMLVAGTQVQVIVGSFVADGKKQKQTTPVRAQTTPEPASAPANMLSFAATGGHGSPRSQGQQQHSTESSEENESHSPLHRGNNNNNNNNNNHGLFGNSMPQNLHQMPMQMFWPNHSPQ